MKKILIGTIIGVFTLVNSANAILPAGRRVDSHYIYINENNDSAKNAEVIAITALLAAAFTLIIVASESVHNKSTGDVGYDNYLKQRGY